MEKSFSVQCVSLIFNGLDGWIIQPNGLLESQDISALELERELDTLHRKGWSLVAKVDKKSQDQKPPGRDLYLRRENPGSQVPE